MPREYLIFVSSPPSRMALSELSAVSTIDLDLESRSAITFYSCAEVNHPTENLNDGELAASATVSDSFTFRNGGNA